MGDFEFEPTIHQRDLPAEVAAARLENAAGEAGLTELLQPRLEGNLAACKHALDVLIEHHRLSSREPTSTSRRTPDGWPSGN